MTRQTKKGGKKGDLPAVAKPEPSQPMQAHMEGAKARVKALPVRPEPVVHFQEGSAVKVDAPHSDEQGQAYALMDALATQSNAFVSKQLRHVMNAYDAGGEPCSEDLGSALAIVAAIEPQNELEAALAVQMALTHNLAASVTARAQRCATMKGMTDYGNLATKAARTFTAQLEALTKLRTGGKQVVEHRHVYIDNRGGQAVITENVSSGVAENETTKSIQSHGKGAFGPAMLGADATGHPVPIPRDQGAEALPDARGASRRA